MTSLWHNMRNGSLECLSNVLSPFLKSDWNIEETGTVSYGEETPDNETEQKVGKASFNELFQTKAHSSLLMPCTKSLLYTRSLSHSHLFMQLNLTAPWTQGPLQKVFTPRHKKQIMVVFCRAGLCPWLWLWMSLELFCIESLNPAIVALLMNPIWLKHLP